MKILVLSPHRDDAALSLALAIEQWLADGHDLVILNCFTQSEYAPFAPHTVLASPDICAAVSAIRAKEDQAWLRTHTDAHNLRIIDLNFEDAPIRLKRTPNDVCTFMSDDRIGEELLSAEITRVVSNSDVEALVLPLALGNHIDHLTARNAILSTGVCQTNPCAFYEDLPYASRPGVDGETASVAQSVGLRLAAAFGGKQTNEKTAVERKFKSATVYSSQIEKTTAEDIAKFCVRYGGRERIWVNSLWRNSPLMHNDETIDDQFQS